MQPFRTIGNVIEIYRYKITYIDEQGEGGMCEILAINQSCAEAESNILATDGCSDIQLAELDTSSVDWLDGLNVGDTTQPMDKAVEIWQMGEQAYKELLSKPSTEQQLAALLLKSAQQEQLNAQLLLTIANMGGVPSV